MLWLNQSSSAVLNLSTSPSTERSSAARLRCSFAFGMFAIACFSVSSFSAVRFGAPAPPAACSGSGISRSSTTLENALARMYAGSESPFESENISGCWKIA